MKSPHAKGLAKMLPEQLALSNTEGFGSTRMPALARSVERCPSALDGFDPVKC